MSPFEKRLHISDKNQENVAACHEQRKSDVNIIDVDNEGAPWLQTRASIEPRKSRKKKRKHGASGEKSGNSILHETSATTDVSGLSDDDKDHKPKDQKGRFCSLYAGRIMR